jgi:hypothetical protein
VNKVKKYNRFLKVDQFSLKFYFEKTGIKKIEKCVIKKKILYLFITGVHLNFRSKLVLKSRL